MYGDQLEDLKPIFIAERADEVADGLIEEVGYTPPKELTHKAAVLLTAMDPSGKLAKTLDELSRGPAAAAASSSAASGESGEESTSESGDESASESGDESASESGGGAGGGGRGGLGKRRRQSRGRKQARPPPGHRAARSLPESTPSDLPLAGTGVTVADTEYTTHKARDKTNAFLSNAEGKRVTRSRVTQAGAISVDASGKWRAGSDFERRDEWGLDDDACADFIAYLRDAPGVLVGWGPPELAWFRAAGRTDGMDACHAVRMMLDACLSPSVRWPQHWKLPLLSSPLTSLGSISLAYQDAENPFSLSMSILVELLLGIDHVHEAFLDAKHEAMVIRAICRAILRAYERDGLI